MNARRAPTVNLAIVGTGSSPKLGRGRTRAWPVAARVGDLTRSPGFMAESRHWIGTDWRDVENWPCGHHDPMRVVARRQVLRCALVACRLQAASQFAVGS